MSAPPTEGSAADSGAHRIGQIGDFPDHKVVPADVNGRTVGILRRGDEIYAFGNRCPHQGAPMCRGQAAGTMLPSEPDEYDFAMDGLIVKCPWHAYEFNVKTGESVCGIIRARLPVYQTEIRDQDVFVVMAQRSQ
jgi:nitrite reductase/ring-hydroxylating ferredoxin subunit